MLSLVSVAPERALLALYSRWGTRPPTQRLDWSDKAGIVTVGYAIGTAGLDLPTATLGGLACGLAVAYPVSVSAVGSPHQGATMAIGNEGSRRPPDMESAPAPTSAVV